MGENQMMYTEWEKTIAMSQLGEALGVEGIVYFVFLCIFVAFVMDAMGQSFYLTNGKELRKAALEHFQHVSKHELYIPSTSAKTQTHVQIQLMEPKDADGDEDDANSGFLGTRKSITGIMAQ